MSRIVTAMFDGRGDAELARERLGSVGVDPDMVSIVEQGSGGLPEGSYSTRENKGFWETLKDAFLPDEDRHTYEEGVRRGGYLLTARVEDGYAEEAVRILDDANTVDIDDRQEQWRSAGWERTPAAEGAGVLAGMHGDERRRDMDRGTRRVRSYSTGDAGLAMGAGAAMGAGMGAGVVMGAPMGATGDGAGDTVSGLANEAVGNLKQGWGELTGNERLRAEGEAQERRGEAQQGERD